MDPPGISTYNVLMRFESLGMGLPMMKFGMVLSEYTITIRFIRPRCTPSPMWRNQDPREYINKRANILILRPTGGVSYRVGQGQVETKHTWTITTSFEDHQHIDEWDTLWWWDWAPQLPGAGVGEPGDTVSGVRADRLVETLHTITGPDWSLVQELDRLGFKAGVSLIDPKGERVALFEQSAYEELIQI